MKTAQNIEGHRYINKSVAKTIIRDDITKFFFTKKIEINCNHLLFFATTKRVCTQLLKWLTHIIYIMRIPPCVQSIITTFIVKFQFSSFFLQFCYYKCYSFFSILLTKLKLN